MIKEAAMNQEFNRDATRCLDEECPERNTCARFQQKDSGWARMISFREKDKKNDITYRCPFYVEEI